MPTLEDILKKYESPEVPEPADPFVLPAQCGFGRHVWPATWQSGDACQCGALYLSTDGGRICASEW